MTTSKKKEERTKRIPISGQRDVMAVVGIDKENYVYRWVNDSGVRIDQFKQAGYEPVEQDGDMHTLRGEYSKYRLGNQSSG